MWKRLESLWTIPDLRKKILFTLGMLLIFRLLANIPVPLTHAQQQNLARLFSGASDQNLGQVLNLLNTFSGSTLQQFSIAALGVYPYITATIVMNLLTPIIPALQHMQQEGGESGRLRFQQITRIITVPLALLQSLGQAAIFVKAGVLDADFFNLFGPNWLSSIAILLSLTAGTMILVWIGELITENGLGNGVSLIIFGGIMSTLPNTLKEGFLVSTSSGNGTKIIVDIAVFLLIGLLTIVGTVYLYSGQRRIPVQYPTKRQVGRKISLDKARTTYIPIQVNSAGMIPLIFAQSMLIFPLTLSQYLKDIPVQWLALAAQWVATYLANTTLWYYWCVFFVLVVAFTYFYAYVVWQQQNIPESLQKQGAFILGFRPGEPTKKYLQTILNRVTLAGALALGLIAILPLIAQVGGNQLLNGAKLLIVVGVVLDTLRQLDAHMVMRNYAGFLS